VIEKQFGATLKRFAIDIKKLKELLNDVIGVVDGSHIPIIDIPILLNLSLYYCKKGFYLVLL